MRIDAGRLARALQAFAAIASLTTVCAAAARAAVLPQAQIDAALASAKNLHRKPSPDTTMNLPYYDLSGSDAQGFVDSDALDYGHLTNGADLLIVPLVSGGSGGVFYTLLFTSVTHGPRFIGYVPSPAGHLDVHIEEGRIIVVTPIYKGNDPNCCPSGHHTITYTLANAKLVKQNEFDTK